MRASQYVLSSVFSSQADALVLVIMIVVSLLMIFAGRRTVKLVIFLVAGLVGAAIGASAGEAYLPEVGRLAPSVAGFFIAGILAVLLLPVGVGLALAFLSYSLARPFVGAGVPVLTIAVLAFIAGLLLSNRLLALASSLFGGFLLFEVFVLLGVPALISGVVALLVAFAGFRVQSEERQSTPQRPVA